MRTHEQILVSGLALCGLGFTGGALGSPEQSAPEPISVMKNSVGLAQIDGALYHFQGALKVDPLINPGIAEIVENERLIRHQIQGGEEILVLTVNLLVLVHLADAFLLFKPGPRHRRVV